MMERRKPTSQSMQGLLLVVLALLLVFLFMYKRASQKGLSQTTITSLSSLSGVKSRQFDDTTKEATKRRFAGFWHYETPPCGRDQRIGIKDRLEVKSNGIIWEVRRSSLYLPNDSTVEFYHVMQAYILPFGQDKPDSNRIVCDARIIRQLMIFGSDTCYGPSQVDCVWKLKREKDALTFEGTSFVPYASSKLDTFFPPKMITYVDSMRIVECPPTASFGSFARASIAGAFDKNDAAGHAQESASDLMKSYYEPLFAATMAERFRRRGTEVAGSAEAAVRIRSGAVVDASVAGLSGEVRDSLIAEMRTWRFPRGLPPEEVKRSVVLGKP